MGLRTKVCGLISLLASCNDREVVRNEPSITYDYAITLPSEFVRQEVTGIDSKVEEFRSASVSISTDFGRYSGPPSCDPSNDYCEIHSEQIAGRDALVGIYRHGPNERLGEPKPYRIFVHVRVDERQGLALNLFARCDTQPACAEALDRFRKVRLLRIEPSLTTSAAALPRVRGANAGR